MKGEYITLETAKKLADYENLVVKVEELEYENGELKKEITDLKENPIEPVNDPYLFYGISESDFH